MGRNNADFEGVTYSHTASDHGALVHANHPEKGTIGALLLRHDGEVRNVVVKDEYRRKGIATGMWNHAVKAGLNPQHSESRTYLGNLWAKSVGGEAPENQLPTSDSDYDDYYGRY